MASYTAEREAKTHGPHPGRRDRVELQIDAYQYGGPTRVDHGVIFKGQPPVPELPAE